MRIPTRESSPPPDVTFLMTAPLDDDIDDVLNDGENSPLSSIIDNAVIEGLSTAKPSLSLGTARRLVSPFADRRFESISEIFDDMADASGEIDDVLTNDPATAAVAAMATVTSTETSPVAGPSRPWNTVATPIAKKSPRKKTMFGGDSDNGGDRPRRASAVRAIKRTRFARRRKSPQSSRKRVIADDNDTPTIATITALNSGDNDDTTPTRRRSSKFAKSTEVFDIPQHFLLRLRNLLARAKTSGDAKLKDAYQRVLSNADRAGRVYASKAKLGKASPEAILRLGRKMLSEKLSIILHIVSKFRTSTISANRLSNVLGSHSSNLYARSRRDRDGTYVALSDAAMKRTLECSRNIMIRAWAKAYSENDSLRNRLDTTSRTFSRTCRDYMRMMADRIVLDVLSLAQRTRCGQRLQAVPIMMIANEPVANIIGDGTMNPIASPDFLFSCTDTKGSRRAVEKHWLPYDRCSLQRLIVMANAPDLQHADAIVRVINNYVFNVLSNVYRMAVLTVALMSGSRTRRLKVQDLHRSVERVYRGPGRVSLPSTFDHTQMFHITHITTEKAVQQGLQGSFELHMSLNDLLKDVL